MLKTANTTPHNTHDHNVSVKSKKKGRKQNVLKIKNNDDDVYPLVHFCCSCQIVRREKRKENWKCCCSDASRYFFGQAAIEFVVVFVIEQTKTGERRRERERWSDTVIDARRESIGKIGSKGQHRLNCSAELWCQYVLCVAIELVLSVCTWHWFLFFVCCLCACARTILRQMGT